MAERRPIVLDSNGRLEELPAGDTVPVEYSVDGGSASSVYLPAQQIDGGDANG